MGSIHLSVFEKQFYNTNQNNNDVQKSNYLKLVIDHDQRK